MFGFYCSRRLGMSKTTTTCLFSKIRFLSTANLNNKQSFVVSYLINSCGFTSRTAESISKRVDFDTPDKPDSILLFFKDQGFTTSQISRIVKGKPSVLLANPKSTLLPKLEFLRSKGASNSDLSVIFSTHLLFRSLERFLVSCCDKLRSALAFNDEKVIKALKHISGISMPTMHKSFNANLSLIREIGVAQSAISWLLTVYPKIMCSKGGKFAEWVKKVLEMGFDPSKHSFVMALAAFARLSDKTWQQKIEVYRRLGENDFWSIFKKHPMCMVIAEENVMSKMNFLVCEMGLRPTDIARVPVVLTYSLETRIIPRCSVVRLLLLKGLIKEDVPLSSMLTSSEKYFLERFVIKFEEEMPQLLDLLQRKVSLVELGFGFEEKSGIVGHAAHKS